MKNSKKYDDYIQKAKEYEEKQIYIDALDMYKKSLPYSYEPLNTNKLILDTYIKLKDLRNYEKYSISVLEDYDYPTDIVLEKIELYEAQNKKEQIVELLKESILHNDDEVLKEKQKEYLGAYKGSYLYYSFVGIRGDKYYIFEENSKKGLLNLDLEEILKAEYDDIKAYGSSPKYAAVLSNREWYIVDEKGRRKLVPDIPVDDLGIYSDNLIPYKYENIYSYMDETMNNATDKTFDYASNFKDGYAAVKSGESWAIINKKFEDISGYIYDDIVLDANEQAINEKVFIAKVDNKYGIYDLKGNLISDTYDYIKPFASEEPTAYKEGDKWGYIDMNGNIIIEAIYEDADAFSDGLAPVLLDEKWGYIDKDNIFRVENTLEEASVLRSGAALTKDDRYRVYKFIR